MKSRARSALTFLAAAGLVLSLAACGGAARSANHVAALPSPSAGSFPQTSPTPTPAAGSQVARAVAYAQCMRVRGVPRWPDPNGDGAFDKSKLSSQHLGVSAPQLLAAQAACQPLLPTGATAAHPTPDVAQALEFAQCMRAHGVANFPDPDGTGRIPDPASAGLDQGSPQFQAANQACGTYRPPYIPSNAAYRAWASSQP